MASLFCLPSGCLNRNYYVTMGIWSPGICCDMDRTSVAWSSSLHSLFSFLMKPSSQSSRETSKLSYLSTLLIQGSLVVYSELSRLWSDNFVAFPPSFRSASAILRTRGASGRASSIPICTLSSMGPFLPAVLRLGSIGGADPRRRRLDMDDA